MSISAYYSNYLGSNFSAPWAVIAVAITLMDLPVLLKAYAQAKIFLF